MQKTGEYNSNNAFIYNGNTGNVNNNNKYNTNACLLYTSPSPRD